MGEIEYSFFYWTPCKGLRPDLVNDRDSAQNVEIPFRSEEGIDIKERHYFDHEHFRDLDPSYVVRSTAH